MTLIQWSGDRAVKAQMSAYGDRARQVKVRVAQYWTEDIQTTARNNARWTDRTNNARQALRSYTSEDVPQRHNSEAGEYPDEPTAANEVMLYLSHGMDYGLFLETNYQGRYAIILETLQSFYPRISQMLKDIFR